MERSKKVEALKEKKEELKVSNKRKAECDAKLEKFEAGYGNVLSEDDFIEYAKDNVKGSSVKFREYLLMMLTLLVPRLIYEIAKYLMCST